MLLYGFVIATTGLRGGLVLYACGNTALGAFALLNRSTQRL